MALLDVGGSRAGRALAFDELERTTAGALGDADRPLGALGNAALWAGLGSGLYLIVVGAWLTPALSITQAVIATVLGAALGSAMVAVGVWLGASANRPGIVLHRGALGESGANLYGAMSVFRHLAWGAVQLAIAAELAAAVMGRQGLGGGRPLWAAVFAAVVLLMVLAGPATVTRRWLVPSVGLVVLIAVIMAYSAWSDFGIQTMIQRRAPGGWPGMTGAVDLVAVIPLIWLPVAVDLGRLGGSRRAGIGAFAGLAGMTAWFVLLGALFIPAVGGTDLSGFLLSTGVGPLALLIVIVLELDGAFVSLYALASTARGWAPKADAALPAAVGGAAVFAIGAAMLDPFARGDALLLLGAAFVPLLGVLLGVKLVRRWWLEGTAYTVLKRDGRLATVTGTASPPALGAAFAWGVGFLAYNWAAPLEIPAWTAAMSTVFHEALRLPFPAGVPGLSATLLGFCSAFAIAALMTAQRARRPQPAWKAPA